MKPPQLFTFPDAEVLARQAGRRWLEELSARSSPSPYSVALSGGRIAQPFFSEVVQQLSSPNCLESVDFFWADERCVPPTDPESNFALAQKAFFGPLALDPRKIHRVRGEMEPARAAAAAETELCQVAPLDSEGQPILDLVFLGMGEDGHIASLFPEEPEEAGTSKAIYRVVIGPKPPPIRVSMNYPALAAARQVWVLVSGPGKESALREALAGGPLPLGRLLRLREETTILTDFPVLG